MAYDLFGVMTIPVSAGSMLSTFQDKTILGLMDYIGWYIKYAIDDKLATLPPTSSDAAPAANRYPWNPGTTFVQNGFPAIYMWQESSVLEQETLIYYKRIRRLGFKYYFDEVVSPGGLQARHGLIPAVDAALQLAFATGRHPSYSYDGDAAGTPIWRTLNLRDLRLVSTSSEMEASVPDVDARSTAGKGHVIREYPVLVAEIEAVERVTLGYRTDADNVSDQLTDATLVLETGDNVDDTLEIKTVVLPGDGAEIE